MMAKINIPGDFLKKRVPILQIKKWKASAKTRLPTIEEIIA